MRQTKRRHHYVSKFLLKRFASRIDENRDTCWVWQFSRNHEPIEITATDAGVSTRFYGADNSNIEDPLSHLENQFAISLRSVDSGESPDAHSEILRKLCWLQAIRTRSMRSQFSDSLKRFLLQFEESSHHPEAIVALKKHYFHNYREIMWDVVKDYSFIRRNIFRILFYIPSVRRVLLGKLISQLDSGAFHVILRAMINRMESEHIVERASVSGQRRGLKALLDSDEIPDAFNPTSWQLLEGSPGSVILGDGCVICLGNDGRIGSVLRYGSDWREIYLPISSDKILVGSNRGEAPSLSIRDVNVASASLSSEFIWAVANDENVVELASIIGTREPAVSEDELSDLTLQGFKDFGAGN